MSLRRTYAIIAFLVVAAALVPQIYAVRNTGSVQPDLVYAPNLMGRSPQLRGNGFASPPISIGNVTTRPIRGTVRVAIILVQFSDVPAKRTRSQIQQDYFGTNQSVASYYQDVSYGKFILDGDIFGWYTLPYPEAHYGRDCNAIDDSDCSGSDQSWQIAQDAVALVANDKTVNVNFMNYDYFVFVHSGNGQETSGVKDDVWSVTYLSGVWIQTNSKTITKFSVTAELEAGGAVPFGVYCHEFGHQLGLPDMYDTRTGNSRMGDWELMDKGLWNGKPPGSEPAELSSWSRSRLGWLPPYNIETISIDSAELTSIAPLERNPMNGSFSAAVVAISSGDYYLFENREPIGDDAYLPDYGIVGYHINENTNLFTTIESPATGTAFHLGDLLSKGQVKAKVLAAFANSSFLVGFGSASDATIKQLSSLTVNVVPSLAIVVTIDNQTYTTDPTTGKVTVIAQYPNETFRVSVPETVEIQPAVRIQFHTWDDGYMNNSRFVLITSNVTLTASYKRQYFVSVQSQYGTPTGSGWFNENSQDSVSVNPTINGTIGTRYVFAGWTGDIAGTTNSISFQVTHSMNLSALWTTFEWMHLAFYDANSPDLPPSMLDSLTLRAPNGTILMLSNLQSDSSFWFEKGTYDVLSAYVYGVDATTGSEHFTTSPGIARIQLDLYMMTFNVNDCILGSPVNGGTVTITLPNGMLESASIKDGRAAFNHLPGAVYAFNISRDWSVGASGETTLPNQSTTNVSVIVIPSVVSIALSIGVLTAISILFMKRKARSRRRFQRQPQRDHIYSDYWNQ